jgi:predicted Zn finger-like uncharacterized protein
MALATRCPSCHALFRVVADQLKLRAGLVRCGACGHVFDAIGTLSYIDDASLRPVSTPSVTPAPDDDSPHTLRIAPGGSQADRLSDASIGQRESQALAGAMSAETEVDPRIAADAAEAAAEATFLDVQPTSGAEEQVQMEAAEATGDAVQKQSERATHALYEEPPQPISQDTPDSPADKTTQAQEIEAAETGFPAPGADAAAFLQEQAKPRPRGLAIALAIGALVLSVALTAQIVLIYRAEIVAQWPETRSALTLACRPMNCTVGWPMRGEMLAVVGSELQSLPGTNALELTAVVRNRASITLALPAIEVTLTDTQDRAIARKVFAPVDYLAAGEASARLGEGIAAGADLTVRIVFEARGIGAAGFVVYPFYL